MQRKRVNLDEVLECLNTVSPAALQVSTAAFFGGLPERIGLAVYSAFGLSADFWQ